MELLVVIAIIGLLVAMLLPAVRTAIAAGRRATCTNHIRQVAMAQLGYESAHGRFAPGNLGLIPPAKVDERHNAQLLGTLPYGLPFSEESALHSGIAVSQRITDIDRPWFTDEQTRQTALSHVPTFLCPSSESDATNSPLLFVNSWFNAPRARVTIQAMVSVPTLQLGLTNYLGSAGIGANKTGNKHELDKRRGIFYNRSKTTRIPDGASKTLMIGESLGWYMHGVPTHAVTWMGSGALPVFRRIGVHTDDPSFITFGSNHDDRAAAFAFGDGHVKRLSEGTEQKVMIALGGIDDGGDESFIVRDQLVTD